MKTMDLKLDWLSFTFKPDLARLEEKYGLENINGKMDIDFFFMEFPEIEALKEDFLILSGRSHYQNMIGFLGVSDTCRISFNEPDFCEVEMGVNVSVPSHGIEWLYDILNLDKDAADAVKQLFLLLRDRNCNISRIDLAFDDYSKTFRPRQYLDWWNNDQIITRYSKVQFCSSQREYGNTIYFGSRKTGKMLRIYDKDFESKGEYDVVRYEFELHSKYAKDMFQYLIDNDGICFSSYILDFFRVVDNSGKDKCVTRMPILKEWQEFLAKSDFCEEVKKVIIPTYTLDARKTDTTYWLLNNCLSNIKGYAAVFGWESLQTHVQNDTKPIPPKYQALLTLAQRSDWDECYDE